MAFAGGWIDQPFVSRLNPAPPGSMVVVGLEPAFRFMDRCGMATGTRKVAMRLWGGALPGGDPAELVRELYAEENKGRAEPSGSQDMIGLIYPGVNRLDYDYAYEGGYLPAPHRVVHRSRHRPLAGAGHPHAAGRAAPGRLQPAGCQEPGPGVDPAAGPDRQGLLRRHPGHGRASAGRVDERVHACWEALLPHTVRHPTITVDLIGILSIYQSRYPGAMYSGCGGGYLYVVSEEPVPGAFKVKVRI